jgi:molybdenum cofactor cytidylyltransferase
MRDVGAVILAAGGSSRLGQPKQLLTFRGETAIIRTVRAASEARCAPVIVVAGEIVGAIRAELGSTSAIVVENHEWRRGPGSSIRRGLEQLSRDSLDAVVLLACDQPFVDTRIIAELIAAWEKTGKAIVASSYANTLGAPALFHRSCFAELAALPESSGAKSLILSRRDDVIAIDFEQGRIDIDTPEDLAGLTN